MAEHLFRQEAVDTTRQERLWGDCLLGAFPRQGLVTAILLFIVITALLFLCTGEYRRKVVVSGTLVPDKGAVQVRSPADGMMERLLVGLGDRVGKGDTVLHIRTGTGQLHGVQPVNSLLEENDEQTRLINLQVQGLTEVSRLKKVALLDQQLNLENKLNRLFELVRDEENVLRLLEDKQSRLNHLHDQGFISRSDLELANMEMLQQQGRVGQLKLQHDESTSALDEIASKLELLALESREQLAQLNRSLSELRQERVRIEAGSFHEVVSPVTGTIAVLHYGAGQAVMNQQALITVIPDDASLEAELYIPSRASGFLQADMPVSLRLDAFPHQKFGQVSGTVSKLATAVILPNELAEDGRKGEPYYKAIAALDRQSIFAWGENFAFRAGMHLEADIQLESRSLLEWLLEPLYIQKRGQG